jgi:hypothetical protein
MNEKELISKIELLEREIEKDIPQNYIDYDRGYNHCLSDVIDIISDNAGKKP